MRAEERVDLVTEGLPGVAAIFEENLSESASFAGVAKGTRLLAINVSMPVNARAEQRAQRTSLFIGRWPRLRLRRKALNVALVDRCRPHGPSGGESETPFYCKLDAPSDCGALERMATPNEENFNDYKRAEKKALELLAAMKAATPKKVDIELALLVAIFELHKGSVPADKIAAIVQGHLKQMVPFYGEKHPVAG